MGTYSVGQGRPKTLRSCLGTRAPLLGKYVRGTGGGEARTGYRREVLGDRVRTSWLG